MSDERADEQRAVAEVVDAAGLGPLAGIESIAGGRNNRAYRAEAARPLFVKAYYRDPGGGRDRARSEFAFARFCWELGLRELAEPLALDAARGIGVFAFVDGRRLSPSEVDAGRVDEALTFFERVNSWRADVGGARGAGDAQDAGAAAELPLAAEACFTIADHLAVVDGRVDKLLGIAESGAIEAAARRFVTEKLERTWKSVRARIAEAGIRMDRGPIERCLSPSDFGFHNALLRCDGRLMFHDFEYAGWDDPAKLVGDFFCQVELPAPATSYAGFVERVSVALGLTPLDRERIELLRPLFRVKWCCIILNELLPEGRARRRFARSVPPAPEAAKSAPARTESECADDANARRQREQVAKAERMLAGLAP